MRVELELVRILCDAIAGVMMCACRFVKRCFDVRVCQVMMRCLCDEHAILFCDSFVMKSVDGETVVSYMIGMCKCTESEYPSIPKFQ